MKILENITYSQAAGANGIGDLYLPGNTTENTPVALCIHGGAWSSLDKSRMAEISTFLCRNLGMAVYNINYRLSVEHKWPAGGDDCLAAARALLNGDIPEIKALKLNKIMVIGGSSGGHYALMTGLRLPSDRVSGIVSISGINSVTEDYAYVPGRYNLLFGHEPSADDLASIDPVKYLKADSPPIFCTHEMTDPVVPSECTRTLAAAAKALGVDCDCYFYKKDEDRISHRIFIGESVRLYEDIEKAITKFICTKVLDYIPEPQPQASEIEISAFYYPGTEQMAEWNQVEQTLPEIKPLLGWYDESNPEVIDWQIKWAVEHGISSFCVDWYWNRGDQRLDHWVRNYYKAKFRKYLKWYIMWANHNSVGAHSEEDQIRVTQFWIDNYFRTPEYYRIDGKPVVVIWSSYTLDRDFRLEAEQRGETLAEGEGVKRALELSNREMRKAGLPDIHFILMYPGSDYSPARMETARNAGFKEMVNYNMVGQTWAYMTEKMNMKEIPRCAEYEYFIDASTAWWNSTASAEKDFSVIPTVATGWDDRMRSFDYGHVFRNKTPEKFREMCLACKDFCKKNNRSRIMLSPINEWQEGSYIEPNEEHGFAMYQVLRDVFCTEPIGGYPPDLRPEDVGRGPYDYPPMEYSRKTEWDFSTDVQGWYRQPFGTAYLRIMDHALHFFRSWGDHAALRLRHQGFPAERFSTFRVMMKVTPPAGTDPQQNEGQKVRLYFGTTDRPLFSTDMFICREGAVAVPAVSDGEWHEYTLDMSSNPLWKGCINELWFDPPQLHSTFIDIRWMKLS